MNDIKIKKQNAISLRDIIDNLISTLSDEAEVWFSLLTVIILQINYYLIIKKLTDIEFSLFLTKTDFLKVYMHL